MENSLLIIIVILTVKSIREPQKNLATGFIKFQKIINRVNLFKGECGDLDEFKFKIENAFQRGLGKNSQLEKSTLKYNSFSYFSPLNLVLSGTMSILGRILAQAALLYQILLGNICRSILFGIKTYLRIVSLFAYILFYKFANKVVNVCVEESLNVN